MALIFLANPKIVEYEVFMSSDDKGIYRPDYLCSRHASERTALLVAEKSAQAYPDFFVVVRMISDDDRWLERLRYFPRGAQAQWVEGTS